MTGRDDRTDRPGPGRWVRVHRIVTGAGGRMHAVLELVVVPGEGVDRIHPENVDTTAALREIVPLANLCSLTVVAAEVAAGAAAINGGSRCVPFGEVMLRIEVVADGVGIVELSSRADSLTVLLGEMVAARRDAIGDTLHREPLP